MIAVITAALSSVWRCVPPWIARAAAILLFIIGARRSGEHAGRTAERLQQAERTSHARQRMLEAGADRPRDRTELVERLRKGGF